MSMKAKQPKMKYYYPSEVGNMSRKVRIMAAKAIMGDDMSKGECINCEDGGRYCPNNIYPKDNIKNSHKRCSCNTQHSRNADKFKPKLKLDKDYWIFKDDIYEMIV